MNNHLIIFIAILLLTLLSTACNIVPVGQVVYEKQPDGWQVKYFISNFKDGADDGSVKNIQELLNKNLK